MGRHRTGSVIKRGDRFEAWVAKEYLGIFDDESTAWDIIKEWLSTEDAKSSEVFGVFGAGWLNERELDGHVRGIRQERSAWEAHIATAHWYAWPMRRITPNVLQRWVGELLKTNAVHAIRTREGTVRRETDETLSRKTVANVVGLLARCFDFALVAGKVKLNPARVLILPPETVQDEEGDESTQLIAHLDADEIRALFKLGLPVGTRAAFAVAIYAGLSKAELWGLRWQDLATDSRDPFVRVRKGYAAALKSKRRRRDVPLLKPAREALLAWKASLSPTPIAGLVFPADGGGCHHRSYVAGWRDQPMNVEGELIVRPGWRSKAGIRESAEPFHVLRHTCGTHLLQGTWAPRYMPRALRMQEVSKWLGHSSIAVTERHYAEFSNDSLRDAVRRPRGDAEEQAE